MFVLNTILAQVARKAYASGLKVAPMLVRMEAEIEKELNEPGRQKSASEVAAGPFQQVSFNNLVSLDELVRDQLSRCNCPVQFPMIKVADGKYRIGNSNVLIFVRVLRSHVMVRVGGGWDTLEAYLNRHDPCRCSTGYHSSTGSSRNQDAMSASAHQYQTSPSSGSDLMSNSMVETSKTGDELLTAVPTGKTLMPPTPPLSNESASGGECSPSPHNRRRSTSRQRAEVSRNERVSLDRTQEASVNSTKKLTHPSSATTKSLRNKPVAKISHKTPTNSTSNRVQSAPIMVTRSLSGRHVVTKQQQQKHHATKTRPKTARIELSLSKSIDVGLIKANAKVNANPRKDPMDNMAPTKIPLPVTSKETVLPTPSSLPTPSTMLSPPNENGFECVRATLVMTINEEEECEESTMTTTKTISKQSSLNSPTTSEEMLKDFVAMEKMLESEMLLTSAS